MNAGKDFENQIKDSISEDVFYHRIKDPAQGFAKGTETRFSLHNEFDAFAFKYPTLIAMELKSTKGTSISYSFEDNKHNIKKCQLESLRYCSKFDGIRAGLLMNFRTHAKTYWLDIENFYKFHEDTSKKSINQEDIMKYGGIIVPQKLKKVKYKYDIDFLFEKGSG